MGNCVSPAGQGGRDDDDEKVPRVANKKGPSQSSGSDRGITSKSAKRERMEALVHSIIGPTTFNITIASSKQKIKMKGIVNPDEHAKDEAKAELGRMINAKNVDLDIWEKKGDVWVADVRVKSNVWVQAEMVKKGLAKVAKAETRRELVDFQEAAKTNKEGMWGRRKK